MSPMPSQSAARTKKPKPEAAIEPALVEQPVAEVVHSIKGFDADWKCRGYQFAVGGTFTHNGIVAACKAGFHAIEGNPLEVFSYYPPSHSRYADTLQSGVISLHSSDSKVASATITISAEIKLPDLIKRGFDWLVAHATDKGQHVEGDQSAASSTGNRSAASSTGDQSAASSTGYHSAASSTGNRSAASSTGDQSAASSTGDQSAASSTGDQSAASSTGDQSAASSTGDQSAASSTGDQSAASSTGDQSAASSTGDQSAASSTGDQSAASSTGYQSAASSTGDQSAAMASGRWGRAMAEKDGCALFLVYRNSEWKIEQAWSGITGRNGIKAGVWYQLDETGQPVEIAQ